MTGDGPPDYACVPGEGSSQGQGAEPDEEQAQAARHDSVGPLEGHAKIQLGHELAEAERPVGAGQPRLVGAHQGSESDQSEAEQ